MKNETYDFLKRFQQYILPALATCYATISKIWGLPFGIEIPATIMALDTLLGVTLGISSHNYYKNVEDSKEVYEEDM